MPIGRFGFVLQQESFDKTHISYNSLIYNVKFSQNRFVLTAGG